MPSRAFGPQNPRDLLSIATYELQKLEAAIGGSFGSEDEAAMEVGSRARACASTLWHMVDWLAHATDPRTKAALSSAGLNDYKQIRDHVKASSDLTLCWELINSIKHFELTGYSRLVSQISGAVLSVPSSRPPSVPAPTKASAKEYQFVPKVKTDSGENLPAVEVFRRALTFWQGFFHRHGL